MPQFHSCVTTNPTPLLPMRVNLIPRWKNAGFTLLEMLVVMLLIGIILSIAGLSVGDGGLAQKQQFEAQRLRSVLQMGVDEALLSQLEIGFSVHDSGYQFVVKQGDAWVPLADALFMPRQLPAGMHLVLAVEGLPVRLEQPVATPQVMLFSSAEVTPFKLWLVAQEQQTVQEIEGHFSGHFTVLAREWDAVSHFLGRRAR